MFRTTADSPAIARLESAQAIARAAGLPYAGDLSPDDAWRLFDEAEALLVDVRSAEERKFVGHVPGSLHVPWATGIDLDRNPRFVEQLSEVAGRHDVVMLLCRSGIRSVHAAVAATRAGFANAFNLLEGFEGDRDALERRGALGGWRLRGLPWVQN